MNEKQARRRRALGRVSPSRSAQPVAAAALGSAARDQTVLLPIGALVCGFMLGTNAIAQGTGTTAQAPAEATLPTVNVRDQRDPRDTRGTGYEPGVTRIGRVPQTRRDIPQAVTAVPEPLIVELDRGTVGLSARRSSARKAWCARPHAGPCRSISMRRFRTCARPSETGQPPWRSPARTTAC